MKTMKRKIAWVSTFCIVFACLLLVSPLQQAQARKAPYIYATDPVYIKTQYPYGSVTMIQRIGPFTQNSGSFDLTYSQLLKISLSSSRARGYIKCVIQKPINNKWATIATWYSFSHAGSYTFGPATYSDTSPKYGYTGYLKILLYHKVYFSGAQPGDVAEMNSYSQHGTLTVTFYSQPL